MFKKIETQMSTDKKHTRLPINRPKGGQGLAQIKFEGITDDSRKVKGGDLFFAIEGARFDGSKFIDEAIKKGAAAVVTGKNTPLGCKNFTPQGCRKVIIRVDNPRAALAEAACDFYNNPSTKLKVIGITGTKGKTTVSYLLASILKRAGFETGVIGTITHNWKDKVIESKNTTPGAIELQRLLNEMVSDSVKYCAMEISSHALEQDRVFGINFKNAIFTNIASEHLDYHRTFENYLEAKTKLFANLKSDSLAILNLDDGNFEKVKKITPAKILTYGIKKRADVWADEISISLEKTEFLIRTKNCSFRVISPLIGIFNVYNTLAAISAALNEGVSADIIKEVISDFEGVEGRLELITSEATASLFKVFVDYAHTDDALKNVLETLRDMTKKRLITVFGCGGDRDRFKRPRMGNVASKFSDYVIITSDNPRSENPLAIAKEIEKGIDKDFKSYKILLDRFEAIKEAINIAEEGDIVLIAGKGHEKYQIIKDKISPFNDKEVVKEILARNDVHVDSNIKYY